jgi:hypothetical protein
MAIRRIQAEQSNRHLPGDRNTYSGTMLTNRGSTDITYCDLNDISYCDLNDISYCDLNGLNARDATHGDDDDRPDATYLPPNGGTLSSRPSVDDSSNGASPLVRGNRSLKS